MKYREKAQAAYSRLHDAIDGGTIQRLVEEATFEDPPNRRSAGVYAMLAAEFNRELTNEFNQFAFWTNRLAAWEPIIASHGELEAWDLRSEFTTLPLDFCLNFPYRYRQRLTYCATQLCYTCGIDRRLLSKDELRQDEAINLGALAAVARHWLAAQNLVQVLSTIDSEEYRTGTQTYRNRSQHRFPPRLDYGHVLTVDRSFPAGVHVSYTIGESAPFSASQALPMLQSEGQNLRRGLLGFRKLVVEQSSIASETSKTVLLVDR